MTHTNSVDLTNCDREPIHIPGGIQPHGCLIAADAAMQRALRHSANAGAFLGLPLEHANGRLLDDILGAEATHELRNALGRSPTPRRPGTIQGLPLGHAGRTFDVTVHSYKGNGIVEFENPGDAAEAGALEIARSGISRIQDLETVDMLIERTPRLLRALLGYDRVMIYRFAEDGSGKVVTEARRATLESFLGQHFPASDIPKQARQFYLKNTIRLIGDASAEPVPLEPVLDASGQPLDLSFAHLRSVSPIHTEYLRNMGVAASMSISIVVDGELWGLIACHHYTPRRLGMARRIAAEMFGDVFSLKLEALERRSAMEAATNNRRMLDTLLLDLAAHEDVSASMRDRLRDFLSLLPADGVGLFMNDIWSGHGSVPPKRVVARMAKFIGAAAEGRIWATHELSAVFPEAADFAGDVSGVLAIPLSQIPRDYLFFFRREQVRAVEWAGNPQKQYTVGKHGDRLTPRKSFALWKQTVERQSSPWTPADRSIAESARVQFLEIILRHNEVLGSERRKAEIWQKVLHEELNHRVKNILSLIKSLVSQPVDQGRSIADYVGSLKGRIMALAFAHDQVIRNNDGGGAISDLFDAELSPYGGGGLVIRASGPAINLEARAFSVLALVVHEMATNAAKYGSLSAPEGRLDASWDIGPDGDCEVVWIESGGPPVSEPIRQGFGSILLQRSIPFDLGGQSDIEYRPGGFFARLVIPAKFVQQVDAPANVPRALQPAQASAPAALTGHSVLLVEDQLVIALDVENMLAEFGIGTIHTVGTPGEALSALTGIEPDFAILDINLGSSTSIPVAEELRARGIPFVFATGYGDSVMIPPSLADASVVRKPYSPDALREALVEALGAPGGSPG